MKKSIYLTVLVKDFKDVTFSNTMDCVIARATKRRLPEATKISEGIFHTTVDGKQYQHKFFGLEQFEHYQKLAEGKEEDVVLFKMRLTEV